MAVTKLMNIKASPRGAGRHLFHAIRYIMNPEKTKEGLLVGGNSGNDCREVYEAMLATKREWDKPGGRQGYHFVLSWKPGEADEESAYQMVKEFCEEYLGDHYDYVFSIHNDQEHMHGHIIFNSVNRDTGYKYRYEKGDWEKVIQPITDRICERHGLEKLKYDRGNKKGKSYAEYSAGKEGKFSWKKIIRSDIDSMVSCADSYEDFLEHMKAIGYRIKTGHSWKDERDYVLFCAPGQDRGWKDKNLGEGYRLEEIKRRIQKEEFRYDLPRPPKLKKYRMQPVLKGHPYLSRYQVRKVRICHQALTCFSGRNPYAVDPAKVRRNLLQIHRLREDCSYLIRRKIRSAADLEQREKELLKEEKILKEQQGNRASFRDGELYQEYLNLQKKTEEIPEWDDRFEELQDQLEVLEEQLPGNVETVEAEFKTAKEKLDALRQEKRIIRHIKKMDREADITIMQPKVNKKEERKERRYAGQTDKSRKGAEIWKKI